MYDQLATSNVSDVRKRIRTFYEQEVVRVEVEKASKNVAEQVAAKAAEAELDRLRPVKKSSNTGAVQRIVPLGASGFQSVSEEEALADVDILEGDDDDDALMENDICPDQKRFFRDEDDAEDIETPMRQEGTNAQWSDGFRLSEGLVTELKEYQLACVKRTLTRLANRQGLLIAHAMGLGKSLTVLAILSVYSSRFRNTKVVLICPKSMVRPWKDMHKQWNEVLPNLRVYPLLRDDEDMTDIFLPIWEEQGGVCIIGYDHFKQIAKSMCIDADTIVVVDEAHVIKNIGTELYKTVDALPTDRRIFMTGTPLQNNLREYYTMIDLLDRGLLGNTIVEFNRRFASKVDEGMTKDSTEDQISMCERTMIHLRLAVRDVMDDVSADALLDKIPLKRELRLLHECDSYDDCDRVIQEKHNVHDAARLHKMAIACVLIDEVRTQAPDDSIVVFSTRKDTLKDMAAQRPGQIFSGDLRASVRDTVVKAFQSTPGAILYVTTSAGGVGINLSSANRVVMLDASWNPTDDSQAISRCYRMGQCKPVFVYRLIADNTIENHIYRLGVKKRNLAALIIDEQVALRQYTKSELKELTGDDDQSERLTDEEVAAIDPVLGSVLDFLAVLKSVTDHDALFSSKSANVETEKANATNDFNLSSMGKLRPIVFNNETHFVDKAHEVVLSDGSRRLVPPYTPVVEDDDGNPTTFFVLGEEIRLRLAPVGSKCGHPTDDVLFEVAYKAVDDDDDDDDAWKSFEQTIGAYSHADTSSGKTLKASRKKNGDRDDSTRFNLGGETEEGEWVFRARLIQAVDADTVDYSDWSEPSVPVKVK